MGGLRHQSVLHSSGQSGAGFYASRLHDPALRERIELAERLGIAPKRLDGWEPATTYVYDQQGRLVSSRPEPEWDDTEVGWLLGLAAWRNEHLCPLCKGLKEVCLAPAGTYVYSASPPLRCQVTNALDTARHTLENMPNPASLIISPQITPWGQ